MSQEEPGYDVFLSYNSRDREEVAKVAAFLGEARLGKRGLRVFFDVESLQPGDSWLKVIQKVIPSCCSVIVFQGRDGLGPWQQDETDLALINEKDVAGFKVIPILLPGADQPPGFLKLKHWIRAKSCWDNATLHELSVALEITSAPVVSIPEENPELSPYRGLLPFREVDAPFYFGRESFIQSLREAVESNSLTALVGPSGSGKSSLVHAGLLPDIRRSETTGFWKAISMRPGSHPIASLASSLARLLEPDKPLKATTDRMAESLLREEESLESLSAKAGGKGKLLLVVDQWEELYTLAQENEAERNRFIEEILTATQDQASSISVLILFRGGFYERVMERPELRRRLQGDCLIPLLDMSQDDLRKAIVEPALRVGLSFDEGLVEEVLQDLEQQPGQLPLLEFVLTRLWNERDKEHRKLLHSSYKRMGGLKGALARRANQIRRSLPEAEVRRLFLRLVHVEEDAPVTRRRTPREELDQPTQEIASRFIENRLLVTGWDSKSGEEIIEIAHEALIHHWRRLRAWLEEDRAFLIWREQLEHDVAEWMESGEAVSFLLTAGPLQIAEFWFGQHSDDLSAEESGYIRLSIEKRERERRLRRILLSSAAALVIVVLVLTGIVLYLREEQAYARSAALAAEAARLANRKFDLALLLALQAEKVKATPEARGTTLSLVAGRPTLKSFLSPGPWREQGVKPEEVQATAFGPDNLIATGGEGKIFLWDAKTGILSRPPLKTGDPSLVVSLAFSPTGSLLAAGSEEGGVISLWDLGKSQWLDPIPVDGAAQNLIFDSSGSLLAWSTSSGIHLWDVAQGAPVKSFSKPSSPEAGIWISDLEFAPSGELVAATAPGEISLGGQVKGWQFEPLVKSADSVLGLAFASDGTLLSAGSSLQRWDLGEKKAGQSCSLLLHPEDEVISVAFSQDRRFVASGHLDRKIRLWEIAKEGCPLFATLSGHSGLIWAMAFGEEGPEGKKMLVSGGEEGDLILWTAASQAPPFSVPLGGRMPKSFATVAVSLDGNLIAVGDSVEQQGQGAQGRITLYDGKTRKKLISKTTSNQSAISRMAFSGDGRLVTGGPEGEVLLWNIGQHGDLDSSNSLLRAGLQKGVSNKGSIRSVAFSQDGTWIAAGTDKGWILAWKPEDKTIPALAIRLYEDDPVLAMTFVREADLVSRVLPFFERKQKEYLVVGGVDGKLTLWDLEKRKRIDTAPAHSQPITSLAGRTDGLFASGSLDRSVRLWRLDQGLNLEDTLFLGWRISDLDLSHQGDLLAAAGEEGSGHVVGLWDLNARLPLGTELQALSPIRRVVFDPQGQALFLGGQGVSAWWDLRPETWAARACDMVRRSFYPVERETYLRPSEKAEVCLKH